MTGRIIAHVMGGTRSSLSKLRRVPPFAWDAAIALGALGLGLIQVASEPADPRFEEADALAVGLVALQTLPLALRRRAPLVVLAVLSAALLVHSALGYHNGIGTATPWLALLTAAMQQPPARSARGYALAVPTIVAFGLLSPSEPGAVTLIVVALTYLGAWLLGVLLRSRHELRLEAERRLEQLEAQQDLRAREAVASERTTLALELHDAVGHGVSAMLLQAGAGRAVLEAGGGVDAAREALVGIEAAGRRAMGELDRMLGMLHGETSPAALPAPGLGALRELARDATALGLAVDVRETGVPGLVAPEVHAAAYRIVQEALTNAGRHGTGGTAEVVVAWDDDAVAIEICNAVAPNGARHRGRHGLEGMTRRAQLVGGTVTAGPDAGRWRVAARLPVRRS